MYAFLKFSITDPDATEERRVCHVGSGVHLLARWLWLLSWVILQNRGSACLTICLGGKRIFRKGLVDNPVNKSQCKSWSALWVFFIVLPRREMTQIGEASRKLCFGNRSDLCLSLWFVPVCIIHCRNAAMSLNILKEVLEKLAGMASFFGINWMELLMSSNADSSWFSFLTAHSRTWDQVWTVYCCIHSEWHTVGAQDTCWIYKLRCHQNIFLFYVCSGNFKEIDVPGLL